MADIFISYKREQRAAAAQVAELLRGNGYEVWWDRELIGGDNFQRTINDELDAAACVVVLWSQLALASDYIVAEASKARDHEKLVGANIDNVCLPVPFNTLQCVSLAAWQGGADADCAQDLLRSVARRSGRAYVAPAARRKKWAVLVATTAYTNTSDFPPLADSRRLAETLARALAAADGAPFHCTTLLDKGRSEIRRLLRERAEETASNEPILFYFRGHARLSPDEGVCLCLASTESDDLVGTALPLRWLVREIIDKVNSEQVVVLLDCAFAVASDVPAATAQAIGVADALKQDLAFSKGKSMLLLTTTVAADSRSSGVFSETLARSLGDWSADIDHDNIITLDEWLAGATAAAAASGEQAAKWSIGLAGSVEIARRAPPAQAAPALREVVPPALLDSIEAALADDCALIPLLGDGIFETGPLSCFRLVEALRKRSNVLAAAAADLSLPEAAEYLIQTHYKRNRERFLADFCDILSEQQAASRDLAIHDFVINGLDLPWMLVSTTYDWALEQRLEQAQRSFLVVAHLLRSEGELLILHCRPAADRVAELRERGVMFATATDASWVIYRSRADDFLPRDAEDCIIYKVLGSPFLNQRAESLEGCAPADSIVITETDHTILLGRLERKSANMPTAFADPFRLRHLLFLGHSLDLWHYRLFGNLFRRAITDIETRDSRLNEPIAVVRPQTTEVEIEFWRALGAEHHLCSVDGLARELIGRRQGAAAHG